MKEQIIKFGYSELQAELNIKKYFEEIIGVVHENPTFKINRILKNESVSLSIEDKYEAIRIVSLEFLTIITRSPVFFGNYKNPTNKEYEIGTYFTYFLFFQKIKNHKAISNNYNELDILDVAIEITKEVIEDEEFYQKDIILDTNEFERVYLFLGRNMNNYKSKFPIEDVWAATYSEIILNNHKHIDIINENRINELIKLPSNDFNNAKIVIEGVERIVASNFLT